MSIQTLAFCYLVYMNAIIIWHEKAHCIFIYVKRNTEYMNTQDQN